MSWLLTTIKQNSPELHIFYAFNIRMPPTVEERDAPGWLGVGPVVDGNPARGQLRFGIYGDLLNVTRRYVEAGNVLDSATATLMATIADRTCDSWRLKDSGMWALPEDRHYTSSKMGC